ncbi:ABC transporter ATP-binding protein [Bauldia sp.]|uniref:ABC transporter ATP-binding protein n=1 Tax=Bauldia sp. TaxID=2575872 RepID=UPI003BA94C1F
MFRFFETLIDPFRRHDESMPPPTLLAFYWRYTRQVWPGLVGLLAAGFMVAIIEVALYDYVGSIVDLLQDTSPADLLSDYGGVFLWMAFVIVLARPVMIMLQQLLIDQTLVPSFTNLVRWQNHRYVVRQSVGFFNDDFAGRIASKIVQTGPSVRESVVQSCEAIWFVSVYSTSAVILFADIDWRLALPVVVWIAFFVGILVFFVPRIRDRSTEVSEARSTLTGRLVDSYTNIQTVKLFAHAAREDTYAREAIDDHNEKLRAETRLITVMNGSVVFSNSLLIAGTMALAVWLWVGGELTLGAIAVTSGMTIRISTMSGWIMWTAINVFEAMGTVQEGMETIAQPNTLVDEPGAPALHVERGAIGYEHVRFHYGKAKGVIEDLSLDIAPGEKVGLVGRSGAGKSTLVNLLLRFYDLEAGRILIDGQDIAKVSQESLRRQIGLVTQDTSLLHRSIRDNIAYGRPEADDAEVEAAARLAHADLFIPDLIDSRGRAGLDAHVGERGVKLSGGQRQRIAIARVLLKDAPILVLDEATSALDSEVEAAIQESLYRLMRGKTVIAIAHRLSTIAAMDRLVVMDAGRIVETGSHRELLAHDGIYAQLWKHQSGGFLGAEADEAVAAE